MPDPIIVDKNKCPRCGSQTKLAQPYAHYHLSVVPQEHAGEFLPPYTNCEAWVCMACGHIEFFAVTLEPFHQST